MSNSFFILSVFIILNSYILSLIKQQCGFSTNIIIIKIFLNRLKIYLQVISISIPIKGIINLQHVLLAQASYLKKILKTIIYINLVKTIKLVYNLIVI